MNNPAIYLMTRDHNGTRTLWPEDATPTYSGDKVGGSWSVNGDDDMIADDLGDSDKRTVTSMIGTGNHGILCGDAGKIRVQTTVERID